MIIRNILIAIVGYYLIIAAFNHVGSGYKSDYTPGAYTSCKQSPETAVVIAEYQLNNPSVSHNQIAHIVCKDAK
jgi:hypothetical protein